MSTVDDPRFTPSSWDALSRYERRLRDRVFNLLEDRMLREGRDRITEDDVRICVEGAMNELLNAFRVES